MSTYLTPNAMHFATTTEKGLLQNAMQTWLVSRQASPTFRLNMSFLSFAILKVTAPVT